MQKFIRVIDGEEYEKYLNAKDFKYLPQKLIKVFHNRVKPRVVCNYVSKTDKKVVGYGVGIFLNQVDFSKECYKPKLIDTINHLKEQEEYKDIGYIAETNLKLDYEELKDLEKKCGVKSLSRKSTFVDHIDLCLKDISHFKKEGNSQKELFVISDDTKVTEQLLDNVAKNSQYIELLTDDLDFGKRLEKDMFNRYGLSLHATDDREKIPNNFDFIINLNEKPDFNISKIVKNKILIDLSEGKVLNRNTSRKTRRLVIIDDLFFKNEKNIDSENDIGRFYDLLNISMSSLLNIYSETGKNAYRYSGISNVEEKVNQVNSNKQVRSNFTKV